MKQKSNIEEIEVRDFKQLSADEAKMVELVGTACFSKDVKESKKAIAKYLELGGMIQPDTEMAFRVIEYLDPPQGPPSKKRALNSIYRDQLAESRTHDVNKVHLMVFHKYKELRAKGTYKTKQAACDALYHELGYMPDSIEKIVTAMEKK